MPHHRKHVPSSAVNGFIDSARVDRLLRPWIPDDRDRAFVTRCILDEGPAHHRGANFVLLALLGRLVEAGGPVADSAGGKVVPIALRLPPHLREDEEGTYPLGLPTAPLERVAPAGSPAIAAMADCLSDGPPQHALANAAMVWLIGVLLDRAGVPPC